MSEQLEIRTDVEHLATLVAYDGVVLAVDVHPDFGGAVNRWLGAGLVEWDRSGEFPVQVVTPTASPDFLARLEAYLRRQFRSTALTRSRRTPVARQMAQSLAGDSVAAGTPSPAVEPVGLTGCRTVSLDMAPRAVPRPIRECAASGSGGVGRV
jgi:hypothetical protein